MALTSFTILLMGMASYYLTQTYYVVFSVIITTRLLSDNHYPGYYDDFYAMVRFGKKNTWIKGLSGQK